MNQHLSLPCILGESIVSKILSVFNDNIVNDDDTENALISEINNEIKCACNTNLNTLIQHFFADADADSTALAFDVNPEHLADLKQGLELKADHLLTSTRKIVILVALKTHSTFEALDSMVHDVIATDTMFKRPQLTAIAA